VGRITASEWTALALNVAAVLTMLSVTRVLKPSETGGLLFAVTAVPWSVACLFWLVRNLAAGSKGGYLGTASTIYVVTIVPLAYIAAPFLPSNTLDAVAKYFLTLLYLVVIGICAISVARRSQLSGSLIAGLAAFATVAFAMIGTGVAAN
jgi:hypothetical protein